MINILGEIYNKILYRKRSSDLFEIAVGFIQASYFHNYIKLVDTDFITPLSYRVDLMKYSEKISNDAITFVGIYNNKVCGFISAYFNNYQTLEGFITLVHVKKEFRGKKLGSKLLNETISFAKKEGFNSVSLIVSSSNIQALSLYSNKGFVDITGEGERREMKLDLVKRNINE